MARKAAGEEPLPEEDPSNPIFKPVPEPSRLDSFLITNQISNYCNQVNGYSILLVIATLYLMPFLLQEAQVINYEILSLSCFIKLTWFVLPPIPFFFFQMKMIYQTLGMDTASFPSMSIFPFSAIRLMSFFFLFFFCIEIFCGLLDLSPS